MMSIFKREWRSYTHSALGWLFWAAILFLSGLFFCLNNLLFQQADFLQCLFSLAVPLLILCPLLAMRSFAEERHSKTDQLLYSLPLSMPQIVAGKYLALLAMLALPCGVICLYPLILSLFGKVALGAAYLGIFSFFLLGAALLAVCMFVSSKTDHLLVAAVVSLAVMAVFYLLGSTIHLLPTSATGSLICFVVLAALIALVVWLMTKHLFPTVLIAAVILIPLFLIFVIRRDLFAGLFPSFVHGLSLVTRFADLTMGYFDIGTWICDLSYMAAFFGLTVLAMEKRRWS